MSQSFDEQLILKYREPGISDAQKGKIFNQVLALPRDEGKNSWQVTIKKYVKWRISKFKNGFDIYDEDDLCQRCLCCLYKAVSEKFDFSYQVKFSTYMYTALEKTVNRVIVELRKKKRTIEVIETKDNKTTVKRLSPHLFTDSLSKPIGNDDKSLTLMEVITEPHDDISENEEMLAEYILGKCKLYLTPMQWDVFIRNDIQGLISGKELAIKYNKSEPTISASKRRKIARVLKRIKNETIKEFDLPNA
jgi:DNA-directed RNA polymerase specialized sigma24 family protein